MYICFCVSVFISRLSFDRGDFITYCLLSFFYTIYLQDFSLFCLIEFSNIKERIIENDKNVHLDLAYKNVKTQ